MPITYRHCDFVINNCLNECGDTIREATLGRKMFSCMVWFVGAFLIAYVVMIVMIGVPLLFMEFSFGQYFGIGSLTIFKKVCPAFQGHTINIINAQLGNSIFNWLMSSDKKNIFYCHEKAANVRSGVTNIWFERVQAIRS